MLHVRAYSNRIQLIYKTSLLSGCSRCLWNVVHEWVAVVTCSMIYQFIFRIFRMIVLYCIVLSMHSSCYWEIYWWVSLLLECDPLYIMFFRNSLCTVVAVHAVQYINATSSNKLSAFYLYKTRHYANTNSSIIYYAHICICIDEHNQSNDIGFPPTPLPSSTKNDVKQRRKRNRKETELSTTVLLDDYAEDDNKAFSSAESFKSLKVVLLQMLH